MEPSIYSFSLCTALPLMLFFGFYFLFAKTPEKKIFTNYLRSRQMMGIAMLLLSANYSVHFFFGIRFKNVNSSILMNMSTYFLCYSLFSSALIMLLDRFYITKRRVWTHIILWIIFSTFSGVVLFLLPSGIMQKISLFALAVWLIAFGVVLARRVIVAYRRAIRIFNETQADDNRRIYRMAFHIHLLGCYLRCRMRIADISARQICFYLDFVVNTVLHLSLPLLSELSAVLRTGGKRDGGWHDF